MPRALWLLVVPVLVACTPALNWREVSLAHLQAVLPCKPDKAQRPVELAGNTLPMDMMGCEASGSLFAISHLQVPQGVKATDILQAWQTETLRNMQAPQPDQLLAAWQAALRDQPQGKPVQPPPVRTASGKGPDGKALQAQLVWWADGQDIYHLAAYGEALTAQTTEPMFTQIRLRD